MSSIKTNYILNLINTVSGIIFPLITFPYISRILFAEGIGLIQFYESIINYIILFTSLGIPLYAVREISRCKHDPILMARTTLEILTLHCFLTIIGYAIVFILIYFNCIEDIGLFLVLSATIVLTVVGVNWFYQGIEDFKYITIRALAVRILSIIALFVFVHTKNDLVNYALIHVFSAAGNYIFNFIRLKKFIPKSVISFTQLQIKRHISPTLRIFALNMVTSIYANLDPVMLGYLSDTAAVGFYSGALKLTKVAMGIVASMNTVMLPRFSFLFSQGELAKFFALGNKALKFIYAFAFPISIGLIVLAKPLILLFCGNTFAPSILTLQILAPTIIIINISVLLGLELLYPQNKENIVIVCTIIGAALNIVLNILLIPKYAQVGAAIASVIAETGVVISLIILGKHYLKITYIKGSIKYFIAATILLLSLLAIAQIDCNHITTIFLSCTLGTIIYTSLLYFLKDKLFLELCDLILARIKIFRK